MSMMRSHRPRRANVRVKIVALLVSMAALWGFAAYVTVKDGLNVLFVTRLDSNVGRPTEALVDALQQERRLSVVALRDAGAGAALAERRESTDRALAAWRSDTSSGSLDLAASDQLTDRIDEAGAVLAELGEVRAEVDAGGADRTATAAAYTEMIDAGFRIYTSVSSLDDQEIARQARTLITLSRARELLSQQDTLLAGALAAGEATSQELAEFTRLVGAQRFLYASSAAELPPEDRARFQETVDGPAVTELRALEDRIVDAAQAGGELPVSAETWRDTVGPATADLRELELAATDNLVDRAGPVAAGIIARLLLAGGLGLVAVIAAVVISITTARSLVRQLERLRDAARELARDRLPRVVARLSAGEKVDVAAEAPPLRFGDDEIGQVGQAFNAVQETAVQAAVQQAELRRGVRDVFLSLARRTQGLVHRQLRVVDGMERRETDADQMAELYRIDHLATRMRRNAENLIVLSGATPGRDWRRPVSMVDVIRGAMAEVEEYQRVTLQPVQAGALEGRVAGDVIHLLAELVENATSFSPPYATVGVGGQRVARGFVVEIEDRGLGMSEADLATANQHLADPPDFSLADASRLGHYVVAKLAQRHGIRVHLRTSPYGGITAIVLVPTSVMAEVEDAPDALAGTGAASAGGDLAAPPGGGVDPAAPPAGGADPVAPPGPEHGAEAGSGAGGEAWRDAELPSRITAVRRYPDPAATPDGATAPDRAAAPDSAAIPDRAAAPAPDGAARSPEPDGPPGAGGGPATGAGDGARTPAGLPWRVRQASLPRQLKSQDGGAGGELPAPDPERVRRAMRSYQLGTQRGRGAGETPTAGPESSAEPPDGRQEG